MLTTFSRNGIFYVVFSLSSWLAPLLVVRLGGRSSMLLATLAYVFHISQYLYLNTVSVYIASVVIGIGAAILFSAQVCTFLCTLKMTNTKIAF